MFNEDYMGLDQNDNFDEEAYAKKLKQARMLGQPMEADAGDENIDMDMLLKLIEGDGGSGIRGGEDSAAEKEFKYGDVPNQIADDELMEGTHEQPGDIFQDSTDYEGQSSPEDNGDVDSLKDFVGDKPKEVTAEKVTIKKGDKKKSPVEKKTGKKYDEPLDLFGENGKQSKQGSKPTFGAEMEKNSLPWNEKGVEESDFGGILPRGEGAGMSEALSPLLGAVGGKLAGKGISKLAKMFGGGGGKEAATAGTKLLPGRGGRVADITAREAGQGAIGGGAETRLLPAGRSIMERNAETAAGAGPREGKFFQTYFGQKVPTVGNKMGERANIFVEPGQMKSMPRSDMSREIKRLLQKVKNGKTSSADLWTNLENLGLTPEDIASILGNR